METVAQDVEHGSAARLLLFFGTPRTGSTFLGAALNQHPNCLIGNEFRFLQKVIEQELPLGPTLADLQAYAHRQFETGLDGDPHYADALPHFQAKWRSFRDGEGAGAPAKAAIRYLGDKKSGGNTSVFMKHPDKVVRFIREQDCMVVVTLRDPVTAARSAAKAFGLSFADALRDQLVRSQYSCDLAGSLPPAAGHFTLYEDLTANPQKTLRDLLAAMALEATETWLDLVCTRVSDMAAPPATPVELAALETAISGPAGPPSYLERFFPQLLDRV